MNIAKRNWSDLSTAPISEEAIRALHEPQENFKLYVSTHAAGTHFPTKAGHAFTLYVLTGSCKIACDGKEVSASAAESIALDQGAYTVEVTGEEPLTLVKVFSRA